jgi:hypothetical protein
MGSALVIDCVGEILHQSKACDARVSSEVSVAALCSRLLMRR